MAYKLNAFDWSWARPSPPAMQAAGIEVAFRYLWDGGKGITTAEITALHAANIGICYTYEADAGNHLLGAAQGRVDGMHARQLAQQLNLPAGTPIYFGCDREVSARMLPVVLAYLYAADNAANPSRCYAQFSVCEAFGRFAWQTVAWSNRQVSRFAVALQYDINETFQGSLVDYNTIFDITNLGAHWPPNHPLAVKAVQEDDDMLANEKVPRPDGTEVTYAVAVGATEYYTQQLLIAQKQTNEKLDEKFDALLKALVK